MASPSHQHSYKDLVMPRGRAEELTGQKIPPAIFTVMPTGDLLHIVVEEPPEEFGLIKIPEHIKANERMGIGHIIAVGPRAGDPRGAVPGPSPMGIISETGDPTELLGLHVIFGSHVGMPLRVSMLDREFRAQVLVMRSRDIRGEDSNPLPLKVRSDQEGADHAA